MLPRPTGLGTFLPIVSQPGEPLGRDETSLSDRWDVYYTRLLIIASLGGILDALFLDGWNECGRGVISPADTNPERAKTERQPWLLRNGKLPRCMLC